jgi:outer membrane immunogenic protein
MTLCFGRYSAGVGHFYGGVEMNKRQIVAAVALSTFSLSAAYGADLTAPMRAVSPPPVATWTWTGCYAGVAGGGSVSNESVTSAAGPLAGRTVATITGSSGIVGGTVGCNYQFYRYLVVGVEDDISWNGLNATAADQAPFRTTFSNSVRGSWLDTLRARAGIATWDNALLYATGGAAFAGIQNSVSGPGGISASMNSTVTGWTVGGGVEYLPMEHWSLKVEYLFVQFPTTGNAFNTLPPVGAFTGVNTQLSQNIIRAGVNWHW